MKTIVYTKGEYVGQNGIGIYNNHTRKLSLINEEGEFDGEILVSQNFNA